MQLLLVAVNLDTLTTNTANKLYIMVALVTDIVVVVVVQVVVVLVLVLM